MLTLFSVPKPFDGPAAIHQRNALTSWRALGVDVIVLGDELGVADAARELGARHLGGLQTNERGTPRLDDVFARVEELARPGLRCFVNADVLLFDDLLPTAERANEPALLVGRTRELAVDEAISPDDLPALAARARDAGDPRGPAALDYFVFPSGLFGELPPFLVGRAGFDNWLVWRARQVARVIDVTAVVTAVHQAHDYGHLAGGKQEAYYGEEAARNVELAGGRSRIYTLHDASHRLRADGRLARNLGSILRARETLRKVAWKLGIR